jgi:hypothetical protein
LSNRVTYPYKGIGDDFTGAGLRIVKGYQNGKRYFPLNSNRCSAPSFSWFYFNDAPTMAKTTAGKIPGIES